MGRKKKHKPGHCLVKMEFRTEKGELKYTVRCKASHGHPGTVHVGARPDGQGIVWDTARELPSLMSQDPLPATAGEALESLSREAAGAE